jgi:NADPH:quinone reductase-like Zn-dependent oxidoreductase
MKAVVATKYGSPDVLQLKEVEKPTPKENEVLVKIHAASANPLDWHKLRASPFFVRFSEGLFRPKQTALGADIAGRVEAVGSKVTQFRVGDEVFGGVSAGGFAEYVCSAENYIVHKPAKLSFEETAAVPVAALTALQGLRDLGQLQAGQKVLINGASGGVGTYAVQLAKAFGAEVTAVCSTRNLELVRAIGADQVIDYTEADFTRAGRRYDLVLDAVGNLSAAGYRRILTSEGRAVVAGFTTLSRMLLQVVLLGSITSRTSKRKIQPMLAAVKREDLATLAKLLEQGKVKSVIDSRYPLADTPKALAYLEKGRARGKVVISVQLTQHL